MWVRSLLTFIVAIVVIGTVVALVLRGRLRRQQNDQVPNTTDQPVTPEHKQRPYRLPAGVTKTIDTSFGEVRLTTARGYYTGTAIYVYLPSGYYFPEAFREAFHKATGGRFHMDRTSSNSGGDSSASTTITAGLDWDAYSNGQQGYFKESPAPDLDQMVKLLSELMDHPMRDSGGGLLPRTSRTSSAAAQ